MSLYKNTGITIRLGFWFFYRKVHIIGLQNIPLDKPVLLVANHPNSFMDALVIAANIPRPTNFMARGDAMKNSILAKIFRAYNIVPVYRISEGKENIDKNIESFDLAIKAIEQNECLLLFGEGLCKNNWDLRPFKKAAARIAYQSWSSHTVAQNLQVVPVGLTYEHFSGGGKSVIVNFGEPITRNHFDEDMALNDLVKQLNTTISDKLKQLAYINPSLKANSPQHLALTSAWADAEKNSKNVLNVLQQNDVKQSSSNKKLRWITKVHLGVIALPHYWLMQLVAGKLTKGSVFYDSVLFALVLFLFPLYWLTLLLLILYFV